LASGTIVVGGKQVCGGIDEQICVMTFTVTNPYSVKAGDMTGDAGHTYWIVATGSPDQMVQFYRQDYFDPTVGNCGSGCAYATVVAYIDGRPQRTYQVQP
jgi:hypothetical protein